jgi:broad specificity phosphatase PhoE
MKVLVSVFLFLFLFTFTSQSISAQQKHQKLTIILLRHAEKDKAEEEITLDPRLSKEGEVRAQRLKEIIEKYKPDAVFSSQFQRTISTVRPYAQEKSMMIQFYNHRKLEEIAAIATAGNFKRILIVGHNSTTPALTNRLIGQDKYKPLDENEYDKIFIVKIKMKKNKPNKIREEKVITY